MGTFWIVVLAALLTVCWAVPLTDDAKDPDDPKSLSEDAHVHQSDSFEYKSPLLSRIRRSPTYCKKCGGYGGGYSPPVQGGCGGGGCGGGCSTCGGRGGGGSGSYSSSQSSSSSSSFGGGGGGWH